MCSDCCLEWMCVQSIDKNGYVQSGVRNDVCSDLLRMDVFRLLI